MQPISLRIKDELRGVTTGDAHHLQLSWKDKKDMWKKALFGIQDVDPFNYKIIKNTLNLIINCLYKC